MDRKRSLRRDFLGVLIETSRHLRHFVDQRAQSLGLTGAQLRVLARLSRREGATQAELAADMEVRPISLSSLIDKLTRQGLVERRGDIRDRRINRIHLTAAGRAMALKIDGFREAIAGEVLAEVDDTALRRAHDVLGRLKQRLKVSLDGGKAAAE
ncbi:MAG: MarR family winged helix-turn-helix transcriptional regulator [Pseudomonadota bacterium]